MNEEITKKTVKAKASAKPKRSKRGKPTAADLAAALEKQKESLSGTNLGGVVGLEEGWTPLIIDTATTGGALTRERARAESLGYTLAPELSVSGMASAEVWLIPTEVYQKTILARRQQRDDERRKQSRI